MKKNYFKIKLLKSGFVDVDLWQREKSLYWFWHVASHTINSSNFERAIYVG